MKVPSKEAENLSKHIILEIVEYMPNAVVSKIVLKKSSGNVTVSAFDKGEELAEKISPFDTFIQVIDGRAEVIIDERKNQLALGEGIVIPGHTPYCVNANEQFKIISTVIKGEDEE